MQEIGAIKSSLKLQSDFCMELFDFLIDFSKMYRNFILVNYLWNIKFRIISNKECNMNILAFGDFMAFISSHVLFPIKFTCLFILKFIYFLSNWIVCDEAAEDFLLQLCAKKHSTCKKKSPNCCYFNEHMKITRTASRPNCNLKNARLYYSKLSCFIMLIYTSLQQNYKYN